MIRRILCWLDKIFRYKPRKKFYFKDKKFNSWVSCYNTDSCMDCYNRRDSEYIANVCNAWENHGFEGSLKKAIVIYKKHRHDKYNGEKRFFLYVESFEEK